MSELELDTKMSESVQTETITKPEKDDSDLPAVSNAGTKTNNNSLRHRKIPSADLNNVSILTFFIKL